MSELRFEPVENALDYLVSAVDQLGEGVDARALKYGVLHLYAGRIRAVHADATT